ncbi:hypothetical protein GpartN1_g4525.t1 [Galdieria partita]|uniref:Uncharacterized protein n=1 Tax=Galdieria partita TaxID=83374 RepID=A0A9C7PY60_9RHOD|nr:hypothetical protein GpartN1_g4525.t1 [Galdieria partita]
MELETKMGQLSEDEVTSKETSGDGRETDNLRPEYDWKGLLGSEGSSEKEFPVEGVQPNGGFWSTYPQHQDDEEFFETNTQRREPQKRRRLSPVEIPEEFLRRSSRVKTGQAFNNYHSESPSESSYDSYSPSGSFESSSSSDPDFSYHSSKNSRKAKSKKKRRRLVSNTTHRNQSVYIMDDVDDSLIRKRETEAYDTSDEDEEWSLRGKSKRRATKRRKRIKQKFALNSSEDDNKNEDYNEVYEEEEEEEEDGEQGRISLRMLGREVINYAEEEEDSENEASFYKRKQEAMEESEDVSVIERVVAHSMAPKDLHFMADKDLVEEGEIPAIDDNRDFDPEICYFAIKWRNRSYRHCSWHMLDELKSFKGFKKVQNYIKKVNHLKELLASPYVAPEDKEEELLRVEMERNLIREYTKVERIVAQREVVIPAESADEIQHKVEYLVKWCSLPFIESTWESMDCLTSEEDMTAIDEFLEREQAASNPVSSRFNPFGSKASRKPFKGIAKQPTWLHGQGRVLRDYQLEGVNWLAFSWCHNRNVILADEMGLGKTLQTIAFLGWLRHEKNVPGPFLIVVPLSTIASWQREFSIWLPDFNVVLYTGDAKSREMIREYEWFSPHNKKQCKFHVLVTTPEMILGDLQYFSMIRWAIVSVDEAHRLKNEASALHQTLSSLTSANRLLITGTPLQNSIRELWALLNYLHPEKYSSASEFEEKYDFQALRKPENITSLHAELRPYILRRQKADVEKSLPRKTYAVLRVGLGPLQAQYYRWILTKNFAMLNAGLKEKGGHATTLLNIVMELKKCCNHPYLFQGVEDRNSSDPLQSLIKASGKLILLDKLLLRLKERGHRVLIFSQMVRMLDILQDYCKMRGFSFQRLDGSMPNHLRQRAVDHYNAPDSQDFVFLLSTRAGGLGINLATADTVIIFDSDWNPQNDLQAESRAHRIGQTKEVKVFRLLSKNTVEEDILERAKRKRVLEHLVISGVEGDASNNARVTFKKEELSAILRFGAEELFRNATEDEANEAAVADTHRLEMDDIDEIIARAAPDDTEETTPGGSLGDSLLNAFKWADFAVDEEDTETNDIPLSASSLETEQAAASAVAERLGRSASDNGSNEALMKMKQLEERDQLLLKETDNEFWGRVIPDHLKEGAIAEELYVTPRKRSRTQNGVLTDQGDSSTLRRPRQKTNHSKQATISLQGYSIPKRDWKTLLKSFRKFGCLSASELIIRDAGLEGKVNDEQLKAIFSSLLEQAKRLITQSEKESYQDPKERKKSLMVNFAGEFINAEEIVRRNHELELLWQKLSVYEDPRRFRFRNPLKSVSFGVRWGPVEDAMLLVGIYRHGFGSWKAIKEDTSLRLTDKINTGDPNDNEKAPDGNKLQRRASVLFKALEKEMQQEESKKVRAMGSHRHSSSGKHSISSSSGVAMNNSVKGSKESNSHILSRELCRTETTTLSDLRKLSHMDDSQSTLDPKQRAEKTRECLLRLGQRVNELAGNDDVAMKEKLWKFIAKFCKTAKDGSQLHSLYQRLTS